MPKITKIEQFPLITGIDNTANKNFVIPNAININVKEILYATAFLVLTR